MRRLALQLVAVWVVFVAVLFLGLGQRLDPLRQLERATLAVVPSQIRLPTPPPGALPDTERRLEYAAQQLDAKIHYVALEPNMYGHVEFPSRDIYINETLNSDVRTMTLAHELAHILQPPTFEKGDEEVWADTVAYLTVLPERNLLSETAHYLGWYKTHLGVLEAYRPELLQAARILRGLE